MEHLHVTQSQFDDIVAVFAERGLELLYSVQDGAVRIYSHFDEVEALLWAISVLDSENSLKLVIASVSADSP